MILVLIIMSNNIELEYYATSIAAQPSWAFAWSFSPNKFLRSDSEKSCALLRRFLLAVLVEMTKARK